MDAFFAAIEERDRPKLAGWPIVVGSDPKEGAGRGVVSTANYAARKYGIHSAQPISVAWRLSQAAVNEGKPAAVFLSVDMEKYFRVSAEIEEILRKRVEIIEKTSVDEAYLDLSFCDSYKRAEEAMRRIKEEIRKKERLTASVGIGPNKLVAKIASDLQKPDGMTIVMEKQVQGLLDMLSVRKLPGVGPKTEARLEEMGAKTIRDLRGISKKRLAEKFGKWGLELYAKARGLDDSPVAEERETKSVGEQETFDEDTLDPKFLLRKIGEMAESVFEKMGEEGFSAFRTVAITVRFSNFRTVTRSRTLRQPGGDAALLKFVATDLFLPFLDKRENPRKNLVRLLGVRVENIE